MLHNVIAQHKIIIFFYKDHKILESQLYPQYFVEMWSPLTWEIVPNSRIEMDPHEHILCQKTVFLKSEASLSGRKQYVAIGTSNICGEDYQSWDFNFCSNVFTIF